MCGCNSFVGDTPYLNKMLATYDGRKTNNFDLPSFDYKQTAGAVVDAGYNVKATTDANATLPAGETPKKTNWLDTLLPIADSVLGIKRTPDSASSFDTGIDSSKEDSSKKVLWWVGGVVVALILIYVIVKVVKKK